jgi:hypothetical protein
MRTVDFWCKTLSELESERSSKDALYQELAEYFAPWKASFYGENSDPKKTWRIYSSKPVHLLVQSISRAYSTMIGPTIDWFSLDLEDEDLMKYRPVSQWLEECERRIYKTLARSNFKSEAFTHFFDFSLFGTGAMFWHELDPIAQPGYLNFRPRSLSGLYVIENSQGQIDTALYKFKMSAHEIAKNYPESVVKSEKIRDAAENKPYQKYELLHVVAPKEDDPMFNPDHGYISVMILLGEKTLINSYGERLKGFYDFPLTVSRAWKMDDGPYGYSTATIALPDAKTKNKLWELFLKALGKDVDPPMLAQNDSIIGRIQIEPGKINWVKAGIDPTKALTQMVSNRRMDTMAYADENLNNNMGDMFHEKFNFSAIRRGPNMSAREVDAIESTKNELNAPLIGRHEFDFVNPLILGTFFVLYRSGGLPAIPREAQGQILSARAVGPLFNSQRMSKVFAMERLMEYGQQMAGTNPEIPMSLNGDFMMRQIERILDAPPGSVKSEKEMKQLIQQQQQQQQLDQGMQNFEMGASGMSKIMK